ncbi:holin family protein [Limimaricola pyoseonensis]|uniref:Holin of 3TMs, for gene-transfer release n=1 Tax=Limimaricola pyoseonensis TaxID=521013 RepID=A0A1G7GYD0_9RHOB|nr:holin family protein [Limimaricola pyoseonensis]SDE92939.1 Holin of 3TMs, for gene-transfer release [Limimaricola pyoseonensis]
MGMIGGVIGSVFGALFGERRNVVAETVEVFRENAEAGAGRAAEHRARVLAQFAAEMARERRGGWDRFIDGLNRLPRPMMAFGTLGLIGAAMADPAWFSERMAGLALVPEPLWWLMGAIVSFYFGARMQAHGQGFERAVVAALAQAPAPPGPRPRAGPATTATPDPNAALEDWRRTQP